MSIEKRLEQLEARLQIADRSLNGNQATGLCSGAPIACSMAGRQPGISFKPCDRARRV